MNRSLLLVDDQPEEHRLKAALGGEFTVSVCRTSAELQRELDRGSLPYDVVLVDYRFDYNFAPRYPNGIEVTSALMQVYPEAQVIALSRFLEPSAKPEAGSVIGDWLLAGARWFCDKHRLFEGDERDRQIICRFADYGARLRERLRPAALPRLESYRGLADTVVALTRIARYAVSVLLVGETGTGKELLANRLHELSGRRGRFIVGNCANLRGELAEVMLHGQEYHQNDPRARGFPKPGWFELADGGTVFLDEVGDLPSEAQASLLRVLQERKVRRVLGSDWLPVDFRLVAATNRPLAQLAEKGLFRIDLYYRLTVFEIRVPALAERKGDIAQLAQGLLARYGPVFGRQVRLSAEVIRYLERRRYPGNVRELENVIQRIVALASSDEPGLAEVQAIDRLVLSPSTIGPVAIDSREEYAQALVEWLRAHLDDFGKPMGFRSKTALVRAGIAEVGKRYELSSGLPRTPHHVLTEFVKPADALLYQEIEARAQRKRGSADTGK